MAPPTLNSAHLLNAISAASEDRVRSVSVQWRPNGATTAETCGSESIASSRSTVSTHISVSSGTYC